MLLGSKGQRARAGERLGFTIVELTVVVTIIAVLGAILFPVFAKAREKARQAQCLSNLQQIWTGLRIYAADNGGRYAPQDDRLDPLYPRYLPHADVFLCPSSSEEVAAPNVNVNYQCKGGLSTDASPQLTLASDAMVRHNGGANFLFADGHVKWFGTGQDAAALNMLTASGLELPGTPEGVKWEEEPEEEEYEPE